MHWSNDIWLSNFDPLTSRRMDSSADEQTPLISKVADQLVHCARMGDLYRMRQLLLRDGVDVNHPSSLGLRPLSVAARHGHEKVARLLLEKGADAKAHDTYGGRGAAPLHWATTNNHKRIVSMLLDAGADVAAVDFNGGTPLHDAARRGNTGVVSMLLAAGANPLARDFEGHTPRDMAATDETRTILRRSGILSGTRPSSPDEKQHPKRTDSRPSSRSVSPRRRDDSTPARSPLRSQTSNNRSIRYSVQLYDNPNSRQSASPREKIHLPRAHMFRKNESPFHSHVTPYEQIVTHYHNQHINTRNDPYGSVESESLYSENGGSQMALLGNSPKSNNKVNYNLPGNTSHLSSLKNAYKRTQNMDYNKPQNIVHNNPVDISYNTADIINLTPRRKAPTPSSVTNDNSSHQPSSRSPSPTRKVSKVDSESLSKFCDEFIHQSILMSPSRTQTLPTNQYPNQSRSRTPAHVYRQPSSEQTQRALPMTSRKITKQARAQSPPRMVTPSQPRTFPALTHTIYNYEQITSLLRDAPNDDTILSTYPTTQSQEKENVSPSPKIHSTVPSFRQPQNQQNPPQCPSPRPSIQSDPFSYMSDSQCLPIPGTFLSDEICTSPTYSQINSQRPFSPNNDLSDVNSSQSPIGLSPCPQASFLSELSSLPFETTPLMSHDTIQPIIQTITQPFIQSPTEPTDHTLTLPYNQTSTNHTLNQTYIQSPHRPSSLPTNQSLIRPINQTAPQPVNYPSQPPSHSLNHPVNQTNVQIVNHPSTQLTSQSVNQYQSCAHTHTYQSNSPTNACIPPINLINTQPVNQLSIQPMNQPLNQPIHQQFSELTSLPFTPNICEMSSQPVKQISPQLSRHTFTHIPIQANQTSELINETFDQMLSQDINQLYTQNPLPTNAQPFNQAYPQNNNQSSPQPQSHIQTENQPTKTTYPESSQQPSTQTLLDMSTQQEKQSTNITASTTQLLTQTSAQPVIEKSTQSLSRTSMQRIIRASRELVKNSSSQNLNKPSTELNKPSQILSQSSCPITRLLTQPLKIPSTEPLKQSSTLPSTTSLAQSVRSLASSHPLINTSTQTLSIRVCQQPSFTPSTDPIHSPTHSVSQTTSHSPSLNLSRHALPPSPPPTDLSSPNPSLSSSYSPAHTPTHSRTSLPPRSRALSPHISPTQSRSIFYQRQNSPRSSKNVLLSKQNLTNSQNPNRNSKHNVEIVVEQKLRNYNQINKKNKSAENFDGNQLSKENNSQQQIHEISKHASKTLIEEPADCCVHQSPQHSAHHTAHPKRHRVSQDVTYHRIHKLAQEFKPIKNHTSLNSENSDHVHTLRTKSQCDIHNCVNVTHRQNSKKAICDDNFHEHQPILIHTASHHSACPKTISHASGLYRAHTCGVNYYHSSTVHSSDSHSQKSQSSTLCASNRTEIHRVVADPNFKHTHEILVHRDLNSNDTCHVVPRFSQSHSSNQCHSDVIAQLVPSKSHPHGQSSSCIHADYNVPHAVTELVELANTGRDEAVVSFVNRGINLDKLDPKMRINALHLASRNGHIAAVTTLLRCGANLESPDEDGVTALHWASSNGHARVVHTLLKAGAKADPVSKHGRSPLHEAAAGGHGMVVNLLLQAGANPRRKDKMMLSPLDIATGVIHSTLMQHCL